MLTERQNYRGWEEKDEKRGGRKRRNRTGAGPELLPRSKCCGVGFFYLIKQCFLLEGNVEWRSGGGREGRLEERRR